jgi:hypothetical protein
LLNSVTKQDVRDQLTNCMLLTQGENGAGGRSDILPEIWFSDKPESYLNMHIILGISDTRSS